MNFPIPLWSAPIKKALFCATVWFSLTKQTLPARILMATSTPNDAIRSLAEEFGVPLFISDKPSGIRRDWNFAVSCAETDFVTIAHQDDVYQPDYLKTLQEYGQKAKDPLILFTDYGELRNGAVITENKNLKIKRMINALIKPKLFWHSKFMRNRRFQSATRFAALLLVYTGPPIRIFGLTSPWLVAWIGMRGIVWHRKKALLCMCRKS